MSTLSYTQNQLQFCQALPKIELHAHLNGSIRDSTIRYVFADVPCSLLPLLYTRRFVSSQQTSACRALAQRQGLSEETLAFLSKPGMHLSSGANHTQHMTFKSACRHTVSARGVQTVCCDTHSHNHSCCCHPNHTGSVGRLCKGQCCSP